VIVEVTVPIMVRVQVKGTSIKPLSAEYTWGGCFSDCEEADGVWVPHEGEWGHDRQGVIATYARRYLEREGIKP
jgi:hypothetical protein